MKTEGWEVYSHGFPDFLCLKEGRLIGVEVKSSPQVKPQPHQYEVLSLLNGMVIDTFLWNPESPTLIPIRTLQDRPIQARQLILPLKIKKMRKGLKKTQTQKWLRHLEKLSKARALSEEDGKDFWWHYNKL